MKFKNFIKNLSISLTLSMMLFSSEAMALKACWLLNTSISGPQSCVPVGTPVTYTGNNSTGTSGCTFHEWTITGGFFLVNGINAGTSTCHTESLGCINDIPCPGLLVGNTSTVTVVWATGAVERSLKLKVKEKSKKITLTCTKEIDVSVTGEVIDITRVGGSCNSGTYTAILESGCPPASGGVIEWFLNSSQTPFTTGTTITYTPPPAYYGPFTLRARLVAGGVNGPLYSESYQTTTPSVVGPTFVNEGSFHSYALNGGSGVSNVTWTLDPALGTVVNPLPGNADVQFAQVNATQWGQLKASGSSNNCPYWEYNLGIIVNNVSFDDPGSGENSLINNNGTGDGNTALSFTVGEDLTQAKINVYPTVINGSTKSVLNIELPDSDTPFQASIVDLSGAVKWNNELMGKYQTVSVDFLNGGIYFLKIKGNDMEEVTKIAVSR